ncbi:hypothetical protein [Butyrivibrio sp. WCE2006]|uniref:hypothetical protein n=1 Tax=Butyrivibrio sp. WCE2006 TaxID=1410611 RepID=UPI0005D1FD83|nr:hypothetical protein [Butyrivibrio sp. WCE2006]
MKLSKEIIGEKLTGDIQFYEDDLISIETRRKIDDPFSSFPCSKVKTSDYYVVVDGFEIDVNENDGSITINGKARVDYTVIGDCYEKECALDLEKCPEIDSSANISFDISINDPKKKTWNTEIVILDLYEPF